MKITLKVESKQKKEVFLKNEQGEIVTCPLNFLPSEVKEGEQLIFTVNKDSDLKENKLIAKNIINEILDTTN